jgi:hypothetical protein
MLIEPKPDLWAERFSREVYDRIGHPKTDVGCRPAISSGVLLCDRKVVRSGRCILHAPKLMKSEKDGLTPDQFSAEQKFEEKFRDELLRSVQITLEKSPGWLNFEGVHFPDIPWNQAPWYPLLAQHGGNFSMAVFHQPTNFSGVLFGSVTHFAKTVFRDQLIFGCATVRAECHFTETVFEDDTNFNGLQVRAPVTFWRCRFFAKARFDWLHLDDILWFNEAIFHDEVDFSRVQLVSGGGLVLESVDLSRASFLYTDLEKVRLRAATWSRMKAGIPARIFNRRLLWDEKRLTSPETTPELHEAVAENYRELVLNSERKREFELAEDFHIGEMEVRRLSRGVGSKNHVARALRQRVNGFGAYRLLSAYGCSYWQAFLILVAFVLIIAVGFMFAGISPTESIRAVSPASIRYQLGFSGTPVSFAHLASDYWACVVHTLTLLTFQRDRAYSPVGATGYLLQSLASVLLAGQGALVLLSIRRNFKR